MKKLLACLLAVLLMLGGMAVAAAAEEDEAIGQPGSSPVVTHITAEWNGIWLFDHFAGMEFTEKNVTVTRYFDDGTSDVYFWEYSNPSRYRVEVDYNREAGVVTVTYMREHQASFDFPVNYYELLVNSHRPLPALALNKKAVTPTGSVIVYTFTPEKDGEHRFYADNLLKAIVLSTDFEELARFTLNNDDGYVSATLRSGETYYVITAVDNPYVTSGTMTVKRPGPFRVGGERALQFVLMPFMLTNGIFVLVLPLYMLLCPILIPLGLVLTVGLSPITALIGFVLGIVEVLR